MRYSADQDSKHYQPPAVTANWVITCNGEPLKQVREFDTEEGWALCFALNDQGRMYADPNTPGQAAMVRHVGDIDVRPKTADER